MSCFSARQCRRVIWTTGSLYLYLLSSAPLARSQITPDGTLPNNTVVIPDGNTSLIEQGTRVGNNLFHSFQEFSIPTGKEAFFNNPLDIQNILTRVTGGNSSNIDGTLRANGTANLFLLNPNGISFGPNAQLNLGGSFLGSTANSIKFSDGSEFSATNPQVPPLLTINVPIGLQFGANPGKIVNQSQANSNTGLQVLPGQTLALVGGDVSLEGGNLTAVQGRIELGSVTGSGLVSLTPSTTGLELGYDGIQHFGTIALSNTAAVNASGLGGGTIRLRGGEVNLTDNSRIVAETFGNFKGGGIDIQSDRFSLQGGAFVSTSTFGSGTGGNLTIRANAVELTGTTPLVTSLQLLTGTFDPLNLSSGLYSFSVTSKEAGNIVGKAGDIVIDAAQLKMLQGANIFSPALRDGNGGNLSLRVTELAELSNGSLLFTGTAGTGNAGNIEIAAKELRVLNGTSISTTPGPTSTGTGGELTVTADSIELRGTPTGAVVPGGLFTTTLGAGKAGDLTVTTTGPLVVADGAQISTSTSGAGAGGKLTVTADSIELNDKSADGRFLGGLLASTSLLTVPGQPGNAPAGDLTVTTRQLRVLNGAQISAATGGKGAAGTLNITASESIEVSGVATSVDPIVEAVSFGPIDGIIPSAIETNTRGAAKAGTLTIQTGQLTVRDRAEVGVRSTSSGTAGDLNVMADSILLENQGTISAVTFSGQGGNITLQVGNELVLRGKSEISTRAGTEDTGGGDGGNITIDTGVLAVLENSKVNANAFQGSGGKVSITTRGFFVPNPNKTITASSTLGVNGIVEINQLDTNPSNGLVQLPENFTEPSDRIVTGCAADRGNQFVVTGRGGLPENPTQPLRGQTVWRDLRMARGSTGEARISSSRSIIPTASEPIVEATGWVMNANGRVELVANLPPTTPQSAWSRPPDCQQLNSQR
jgi:filamentous hemagglutinin family protein